MYFAVRLFIYLVLVGAAYASMPWSSPHLHQHNLALGVLSAHAEDVNLVKKAVRQWSQHISFQAFRVHRVPYDQGTLQQHKALISFVPHKAPKQWPNKLSWSKWLKRLHLEYKFHHSTTEGQTRTTYNALGRIQQINIFVQDELQGDQRYFVVLHELGHALGLGHSQHENSIMHAYLGRPEITADDRLQLARLYSHHR